MAIQVEQAPGLPGPGRAARALLTGTERLAREPLSMTRKGARRPVLLDGPSLAGIARVGAVTVCATVLSAAPPTASPAPRTGPSALGQHGSGQEPAGPWDNDRSPANCPVTGGKAATTPPASFVPTGFPVPWVRDWYGNAALWVRLPRGGVLPVGRNPPGGPSGLPWGTKFPWWKARPGTVEVHARPIGGRAGRFSADVLDYSELGFSPSGLNFSALGCWQLTATNAGTKLTFTVWVDHFSWA